MNNQEAYKWIYTHFASCEDQTKQDEAISIALKAIAKQIPTKPKKAPLHKKRCPYCNKVLTIYDWLMPHCKCCGQAIDWTEDE